MAQEICDSQGDVSPHIDKLAFSIPCNNKICNSKSREKDFFLAIKNIGFKYKHDVTKKDPKNMPYYKRMRQYCYGSSLITFFYKRGFKAKFRPHMWCIIEDPCTEAIHYLDSLCNSFGFITSLSQIELALDFPYEFEFQEFFWKHLFVKRNRGDSRFCAKDIEKSFYSGHKAKNSKIMIVYSKMMIDGEKVLRLELILNRPIIKRLGLDSRLENIGNIDLSKFFCFKE